MSRIKTGRSLTFVVNGRYEVALKISFLKASNVFPDRQLWLKYVKKSEFFYFILFSFKHKYTLCVQIVLKNDNF